MHLNCGRYVMEAKARMPIAPYFVVVGTMLTVLLVWISNEMEPNRSMLFETRPVVVKKSFKVLPEPRYRITAFNFAAPYSNPATTEQAKPSKTERAERAKPSTTERTKAVSTLRRQNGDSESLVSPAYRLATYPNNILSIH